MVVNGSQSRIVGDFAEEHSWIVIPSLPADQPALLAILIQVSSTFLPQRNEYRV